jgi:predicted nuclease of restriction endonuclease-like (RecB) superfamily
VTPSIVLKDPYALDFLGVSDRFLERELEEAILQELETFLLEPGFGFSFVARQKRIQLDGDHFYIDLLFYNLKLNRLIAVELKQGSFKPEYKGYGARSSLAGQERNRSGRAEPDGYNSVRQKEL